MKFWRITLRERLYSDEHPRIHFDYDNALYQVTTEQGWAKVWSRGGEFSTGKALDLGVTLKESWPESVLYKVELLETDDE